MGITAGLVLTVATALAMLSDKHEFVPMLSLLGNYFFGYQVSWRGIAVGIVESSAIGFAFGWTTAKLLNCIVGAFENGLVKRLEMSTAIDVLEGGDR